MKWKKVRSRLFIGAAIGGLAWITWDAFQPQPVQVEVTSVIRGPLEITIDEDGQTRAHDKYVVSAPVAGRLQRIELHEGDTVAAGQVVGTLYPTPMDPVARREVEEKLRAAQAIRRQLQALASKAEANHQQARRDEERAAMLSKQGDIPKTSYEKAQIAETAAGKDVAALRAQIDAAAADIRALESVLQSQQAAKSQPVAVRSPVAGKVMRVEEKSERVMRASEPLLTLGNAKGLEIVVDVLSTEAVQIRPGMPARLVNWGGTEALPARVRTVEPSAFRKVSALGVEEQRVNVILDFLKGTATLGDGYRVEARIIIWSSANVRKVASGALFRCGEQWCALVLKGDAVHKVTVAIGHRSSAEVELIQGLEEGAQVVLHPPNALEDGRKVRILTP